MTIWWLILGVAVTTALIKAAGPVLLGGRPLPGPVAVVVSGLAPALLAALVVTSALADGDRWQVDAGTAGVVVGGVLLVLRRPLLVAIVAAAATAALLRWLTG